MFTVVYETVALRDLGRLETKIKRRIVEKISATKENPHHYFERLAGRQDYKLRVGNYRVIADIDEGAQRISILYVAHRKNIYQKRFP